MGLFDIFKKNKKAKDEKYKLGMHKTRENSFGSIKKILEARNVIDDELFDELEEVFIMADVGVDTVISFVDNLRDEVSKRDIKDPLQLQEIIIDKMFEIYLKGEIVNANLNLNKNGLSVLLFVSFEPAAIIVDKIAPSSSFHVNEVPSHSLTREDEYKLRSNAIAYAI